MRLISIGLASIVIGCIAMYIEAPRFLDEENAELVKSIILKSFKIACCFLIVVVTTLFCLLIKPTRMIFDKSTWLQKKIISLFSDSKTRGKKTLSKTTTLEWNRIDFSLTSWRITIHGITFAVKKHSETCEKKVFARISSLTLGFHPTIKIGHFLKTIQINGVDATIDLRKPITEMPYQNNEIPKGTPPNEQTSKDNMIRFVIGLFDLSNAKCQIFLPSEAFQFVFFFINCFINQFIILCILTGNPFLLMLGNML